MKWLRKLFAEGPQSANPSEFSFTNPERTDLPLITALVTLVPVLLITYGFARSLIRDSDGWDLIGVLGLGLSLLVLGMLAAPLGREISLCHSVRVDHSMLTAVGRRADRTIPIDSIREIGRLRCPTVLHPRGFVVTVDAEEPLLLAEHPGMAQVVRILSEEYPHIEVSTWVPKRNDNAAGLDFA